MAGWIGAAVLAAAGGLTSPNSKLRQVPLLAALAAAGIFISWQVIKKRGNESDTKEDGWEFPATAEAPDDKPEVESAEHVLDHRTPQAVECKRRENGCSQPVENRWEFPARATASDGNADLSMEHYQDAPEADYDPDRDVSSLVGENRCVSSIDECLNHADETVGDDVVGALDGCIDTNLQQEPGSESKDEEYHHDSSNAVDTDVKYETDTNNAKKGHHPEVDRYVEIRKHTPGEEQNAIVGRQECESPGQIDTGEFKSLQQEMRTDTNVDFRQVPRFERLLMEVEFSESGGDDEGNSASSDIVAEHDIDSSQTLFPRSPGTPSEVVIRKTEASPADSVLDPAAPHVFTSSERLPHPRVFCSEQKSERHVHDENSDSRSPCSVDQTAAGNCQGSEKLLHSNHRSSTEQNSEKIPEEVRPLSVPSSDAHADPDFEAKVYQNGVPRVQDSGTRLSFTGNLVVSLPFQDVKSLTGRSADFLPLDSTQSTVQSSIYPDCICITEHNFGENSEVMHLSSAPTTESVGDPDFDAKVHQTCTPTAQDHETRLSFTGNLVVASPHQDLESISRSSGDFLSPNSAQPMEQSSHLEGSPPTPESTMSASEEFFERQRAYDDYLSDPNLSPRMRAQVLRAKAALEKFYDFDDL